MSAITWAAWLVVKVTCLFLVALAFDALLRRRWVLITAALWNAMLVALVVLPAAALLGPRVELPLLAADAAAESAPNGAPIARAAGGRRPPVPADHAPAVDRAVAQPPPNDADASARWPTDEPRSNERVAWHFLAIALGWLYAAGVAVVAVRLAASWRAVDGLLAHAASLEAPTWTERLRYWQATNANTESIERGAVNALRSPAAAFCFPVRLLYSNEIDVPLAVGIWRPTIVIPTRMAAEDGCAAIDAVLTHELAHLARGDCSWQWAQRIVEAVWWFHPLVWLARRRIAFIRERACDEFAVHALGDADLYTRSLLSVAAAPAVRRALGLGLAVVRPGNLAQADGSRTNARQRPVPGLADGPCFVPAGSRLRGDAAGQRRRRPRGR